MGAAVPDIGLGKWILQKLRHNAQTDAICLICGDDGSTRTHKKTLENSVWLAAGLQSLGAKAGDRLLLVSRNCHEAYAIAVACFLCDITVMPAVFELSAEELSKLITVTKPTLLMTPSSNVANSREAVRLSGLESSCRILELSATAFQDMLSRGMAADPATFQPVEIDDPKTHAFACFFSSGTTGPSKGVLVTDRGLLRSTYFRQRSNPGENSRPILNPAQPHWSSWLSTFTSGLLLRKPVLFMNSADSNKILDAINTHKPSSWTGHPDVFVAAERALKANPGRWDMSSLKVLVSIGDILNGDQQDGLSRSFGVPVHQLYGSTECGVVCLTDTTAPVINGSVGKPVVPVKLVDPNSGAEITEANKTGELLAEKGYMKEYMGNPEATVQISDHEGWIRTGDLAYFSEQGHFYIVDRLKEVFKYNGHQMAPSELERYLREIPGIREAAVVGKPDPAVGEIPTAFVVKEPASTITADHIQHALLKHKLADWKKLRGGIFFVETLPKNSNRKIDRKRLRLLLTTLES